MKAIHLFKKTKNPDHVLYIILFQACTQIGSNEGLDLIESALNNIPPLFCKNERLLTTLIDGLMECGNVEKAESIFYSTVNQPICIIGAMIKGKMFVIICPKTNEDTFIELSYTDSKC